MDYEEVQAIALSYPGVEEQLVFGRPTFKVRKRFLACIAKIDSDTLVLKVSDQFEREFLLNTQPDVYYLTDHYIDFACVLVRIPEADSAELRDLFERAWRTYAPKRLVASYEATD